MPRTTPFPRAPAVILASSSTRRGSQLMNVIPVLPARRTKKRAKHTAQNVPWARTPTPQGNARAPHVSVDTTRTRPAPPSVKHAQVVKCTTRNNKQTSTAATPAPRPITRKAGTQRAQSVTRKANTRMRTTSQSVKCATQGCDLIWKKRNAPAPNPATRATSSTRHR